MLNGVDLLRALSVFAGRFYFQSDRIFDSF